MSKLYQIIFPCLIFFISIQGISRNSNDNGPHQELNPEYQEITIELDAFEIYNNFTNNYYSLGFIDEPELNKSATYSIVAGNRKGIWEVNKTTGELILKDADVLNNTEEFQYRILIEQKDEMLQDIISKKKVTITVQIENIAEYFEINGNSENVSEKVLLEEKNFNSIHQSNRNKTSQ